MCHENDERRRFVSHKTMCFASICQQLLYFSLQMEHMSEGNDDA